MRGGTDALEPIMVDPPQKVSGPNQSTRRAVISEGPTVRIALASTRRAHRIEHRTRPHMASLDTTSEDADETNVLLTDPLPE